MQDPVQQIIKEKSLPEEEQVKEAQPQQGPPQPDKTQPDNAQPELPSVDTPATKEVAAAKEVAAVDIEAQQKLLKDIEDQCVSHGRHPGEWDNLKVDWVDSVRSHVPHSFCSC